MAPLLWGWAAGARAQAGTCGAATPRCAADADAYAPGDAVEHLGNGFEWTAAHRRPRELEPLRSRGDALADDALPVVLAEWRRERRQRGGSGVGGEGGGAKVPAAATSWLPTSLKPLLAPLLSLRSTLALPARTPAEVRGLEEGALADSGCALGALARAAGSGDARARALLEDVSTLPEWADTARCARGAEFFLRYLPGCGACLLHLSLVGGYAAPRIARVLSCGGALRGDTSAAGCDRAYRRLLETAQLVAAVVAGPEAMVPVHGAGWRAVVRVRLMHAAVRARLSCSAAYEAVAAADGVPINQIDMVVTQLAFSAVVVDGLERLGVDLSDSLEAVEDFLHLWRVVGHCIGIDEEHNLACRSLPDARAALQSIWVYLVWPDQLSTKLASATLAAVEGRPPRRATAEQLAHATRVLQGNALADALGIEVRGDGRGAAAYTDGLRRAARWSGVLVNPATVVGRLLLRWAAYGFGAALRSQLGYISRFEPGGHAAAAAASRVGSFDHAALCSAACPVAAVGD